MSFFLPLQGSLEHLEDEIIPFFEEWPSSVYLSQLPGPVDRLLLHALCQYVGLCSHSKYRYILGLVVQGNCVQFADDILNAFVFFASNFSADSF